MPTDNGCGTGVGVGAAGVPVGITAMAIGVSAWAAGVGVIVAMAMQVVPMVERLNNRKIAEVRPAGVHTKTDRSTFIFGKFRNPRLSMTYTLLC